MNKSLFIECLFIEVIAILYLLKAFTPKEDDDTEDIVWFMRKIYIFLMLTILAIICYIDKVSCIKMLIDWFQTK